MATFTFTNEAFKLNLSPSESRALGRRSLSLDKARIKSFRMIDFPERVTLGQKVSKSMLFNSLLGEYRNSSDRTLVLGKLSGTPETLKIAVSHPSIDQILVCGAQVSDLESKLAQFLEKRK